jgi:hypothetical protein
MQFGMVDLPMTKAQVLATLASPLNAFKIVNATEPVGAFIQDRHTGIMGEFGKTPEMIPVTLNIRGGGSTDKQFHYEILNNPHLSPVAMMATVYNALHGVNEYGEDITYRMNGSISVNGYPQLAVQNMFTATEQGQPAAVMAAMSLGDRFSRIYDNPYNAPDIRGVQSAASTTILTMRPISAAFNSISKSSATDAGLAWKAPAPMLRKPAPAMRSLSKL